MAQRLIRLTLYDEATLAVLDDLSKARKQSMFVLEALRHFLGTEEGQQLLKNLTLTESPASEIPQSLDQEEPRQGRVDERKGKSNLDDIFR
ncbi:hypothetical protein [Geothermobacter hydrogeniphilus]|uniref:Uncharacterized protein n=1 Tax=Geothermobacter hydrogeniphilus TaxID=1969733 RepID=A0A1X0XX35_9BACT|nr:hypothetical protein [Geothermobacter hydrogeniphilus]ORJ57483.1 hypothetical protein B5V00_13620 [Geothermobacter hydrogeniphilus]